MFVEELAFLAATFRICPSTHALWDPPSCRWFRVCWTGFGSIFAQALQKLRCFIAFFNWHWRFFTTVVIIPSSFRNKLKWIFAKYEERNPVNSNDFKAKLEMLAKGILRHDTLWDRLLFRNMVHRAFGARLRLITTGGAPITTETMNFSRCVYGCPVFEGYANM